jgi:hypothetical protein
VRSGESSHWPFRVRSRCCGTTTKGSPFTTWRHSQAALAGLLSAEFHWRGCTLQEEDASWVTKCLVSGRQEAQVVGLHDLEQSSRSVLLALEKKVRDTHKISQLEKVNRQEVWEECTTEGEAMEALAASRLRLLQQRKLRLDALKLAKGWEDEVAFMSLPLTTQYGSSPSPSASPCRRSRNDAPSVFPVPNTHPLEDERSASRSFPSRRKGPFGNTLQVVAVGLAPWRRGTTNGVSFALPKLQNNEIIFRPKSVVLWRIEDVVNLYFFLSIVHAEFDFH